MSGGSESGLYIIALLETAGTDPDAANGAVLINTNSM